MNKQELANTIWKSANEYKDYILGFIFYKFLSDKEEKGLKEEGCDDSSLEENLIENNEEMVTYCKR